MTRRQSGCVGEQRPACAARRSAIYRGETSQKTCESWRQKRTMLTQQTCWLLSKRSREGEKRTPPTAVRLEREATVLELDDSALRREGAADPRAPPEACTKQHVSLEARVLGASSSKARLRPLAPTGPGAKRSSQKVNQTPREQMPSAHSEMASHSAPGRGCECSFFNILPSYAPLRPSLQVRSPHPPPFAHHLRDAGNESVIVGPDARSEVQQLACLRAARELEVAPSRPG